jgi:hypothetical protein
MSNIKEVNKKLFQIQMLLEECIEELKQSNDQADQDLAKLQSERKTSEVITKSSQFVFGD